MMQTRPPDRPDDDRLGALLAAVPRRAPSAAFGPRLLAATRQAWPAPSQIRQWAGVRSELVISAGVVAGAALLTLTPVAVVVGMLVFDAGAAVGGLARVCVLLVEWLNAGLSLWEVLARAGRVTGAAIGSPVGTGILLGGVLTASLALAGLSRVLPGEAGDV
jgi:hypothetical protein